MKASELRIGNLIKYKKGHIGPITMIQQSDRLPVEAYIEVEHNYLRGGVFEINQFYPIPITREAVADFFGLTETDDHDNHIVKSRPNNTCQDITVWIASEGGIAHVYVGDNQGATVTIHSIHELQNVYFALTKEELEIKE